MKNRAFWMCLGIVLLNGCCASHTTLSTAVIQDEASNPSAYPPPERLVTEIIAFEAQDQTEPPPHGAIVCVGSSSIRGWHSTIQEDLAPLTIIPRGFGGSTMNDAVYYTERIVTVYEPRAVVLYEGDNDIWLGISPQQVAERFAVFVTKIHEALPDTRIYVLSIKPSIARWEVWPQMKEANRLIEKACLSDVLLTYTDVSSAMLDETGQPRREIFQPDMLHLNESGYAIWKAALLPVLLEKESPSAD